MRASRTRKLTVEQFYDEYGWRDEKYELVDGEAWLMSGGTVRHAMIAGNILTALRQRLRGSGCMPFNSDMGLRLSLTDVRYPDVAVYCDPRDLTADDLVQRDLRFPSLIFEVLSKSTMATDRAVKMVLYRGIPSVEAIVLIDPDIREIELHERVGPSEWRLVVLDPGATLELRKLAVTLTHDEIFARD